MPFVLGASEFVHDMPKIISKESAVKEAVNMVYAVILHIFKGYASVLDPLFYHSPLANLWASWIVFPSLRKRPTFN